MPLQKDTWGHRRAGIGHGLRRYLPDSTGTATSQPCPARVPASSLLRLLAPAKGALSNLGISHGRLDSYSEPPSARHIRLDSDGEGPETVRIPVATSSHTLERARTPTNAPLTVPLRRLVPVPLDALALRHHRIVPHAPHAHALPPVRGLRLDAVALLVPQRTPTAPHSHQGRRREQGGPSRGGQARRHGRRLATEQELRHVERQPGQSRSFTFEPGPER